jgi:hypothetical protein
MGDAPATVAFTVLWPTVVPWLAAALLPLLLAWLPVRHGNRIRWAATEFVFAAAKREGLGRHGIPTVLVALRVLALAAVALAAARPFLGLRSPGRGVPVVAGVADRSIEIVVPDAGADDDAAVAIRRSLEALAATPSTLVKGGVPTVEVVSPQAAGAAFKGRRLIILCDGVVPDAADARRLDAAVRAGSSLLVCLGPDSTSPILRPQLSAWLQGLVGIDVAGAVTLRDAAIDAHGLGDGDMTDLLSGPTVARSADIALTAARWTVLAQTKDGSRPLVAETAVDRGRVCIATIPLALRGPGPDDEAWSDLAAWPAFLPFVDRLASHLLAPAAGETVVASSPFSGAALARPLLGIAAAAILAEWVLSASLASAATVPWLGRAALLLLCGGMALLWSGPPRPWPSRDGRRRPVALLVDASPSMATRDVEAAAGGPRARIAAVQEAFTRDGGRTLLSMARGRGLSLATTGTWSAADGDVTAAITGVQAIVPPESATHASRLGDAVASLLTAADPPAAVIVASDGAISDGSSWADVARLARRRRVPLVAIPVGDATADDDQPVPTGFRFTSVAAPAVCRPDERLPLTVAAAAGVPHRRSLPLAATSGSGSLAPLAAAVAEPLLQRFAGRCDDRVEAAETRGAVTTLTRTVRLGSTTDPGHVATLPIVVASAPIRVLLVDTVPRYEYRFLDRLLAGDPRFEVTSVLLASRDRKEARPTGSLPASIDGWNAFDVIVVGDVPIATAADDDAPAWAALAAAAARHGIGIAWLPGRRWARDDAGLRSWLPAAPRGAGSRGEGPRRLAIAEASTGGGWFSFLDDRPPDAAPFAPEVYAVLDAIDCGPGSRIVAVATDQPATVSAAMPAIVTARHGAATVLAHFCETWRWRDAAGDDLHSRYWLHALGRLAERHLLGRLVDARLEARPCDPIVGETVWIDVVPTRDDVSLAGWAVEVEAEGTPLRRVSLDAGAAATIPLAGLPAGRHAVRLVPSGQPPAAKPAAIRREIIVNEPARETVGGPSGSGPFAEAARLSGGAVVPLDRLDTLPDTISRLDAERAAATARSGPRWFESQAFAHLLLAATVATGLVAWRQRPAGGW